MEQPTDIPTQENATKQELDKGPTEGTDASQEEKPVESCPAGAAVAAEKQETEVTEEAAAESSATANDVKTEQPFKYDGDPSMHPGKLFIGGVSWDTTEDGLRYYFERYGKLIDVALMKNKMTGQPRGFGFVTYENPKVVETVLEEIHTLDNKTVEVKRAVPREKTAGTVGGRGDFAGGRQGVVQHPSNPDARVEKNKIFVGGLASSVDDATFKEYFGKYGKISDAVVMMDKDTGHSRGFGFITFDDEGGEKAISEVMSQPHTINEKTVEVKLAEPKEATSVKGGGKGYGYGAGQHRYGGAGYGSGGGWSNGGGGWSNGGSGYRGGGWSAGGYGSKGGGYGGGGYTEYGGTSYGSRGGGYGPNRGTGAWAPSTSSYGGGGGYPGARAGGYSGGSSYESGGGYGARGGQSYSSYSDGGSGREEGGYAGSAGGYGNTSGGTHYRAAGAYGHSYNQTEGFDGGSSYRGAGATAGPSSYGGVSQSSYGSTSGPPDGYSYGADRVPRSRYQSNPY